MRTYKQLNLEQRYQIDLLKKMGKENKEIALWIGCSESTISRELRRNGGTQAYAAREAQEQVMSRRRQGRQASKIAPRVIELIRQGILYDYS